MKFIFSNPEEIPLDPDDRTKSGLIKEFKWMSYLPQNIIYKKIIPGSIADPS
jgi:hypothetical protein